jgi:uroporphyrinogen decarboxylase
MLISPDCWRKLIKPYLAQQVRTLRDSGMFVMYHSCGSVRPILHDLIEIGVNALLVFQTNARGMDVESIAREFGGRLAFYGGIDVQYLLSFGSEEEVKSTVAKNIRAFESCGGYIVANSHHGLATIRGDNLETMFAAAKQYEYSR